MLTHDQGRAEDLVQDALVKVHRRWDRVRAAEQPDAYVRRVVTNEFLNWRRRRSNTELPGELHNTPVADPSALVDERDAMWRALAVLPPRQRAVLVLKFYEDMPDAQIAAVLECAPARSQASHPGGWPPCVLRTGPNDLTRYLRSRDGQPRGFGP
jgi:RNA polymerase sigma factor (sigma-70 family)